jgi:NOL1/NOP2/fmu family ribosome biogenesis protein
VTDWSEETVLMCARRQAEILHSGAQLVRPGGRLVYSTCTFAPAENEEAIAAFLAEHPDFEPEAVEAPWFTPGENGSFRIWPHKVLGEGHFAAVLRRKGADEAAGEGCSGRKLPKEWEDFAKELDIQLPEGKAITFGQSLYWAPVDLPELRGWKVERPGLELGLLKKNRFEPAHALALWLKTCGRVMDLEPEGAQIEAYMSGNVIPGDKKGWCLVTVGGYSIGWGKGDGQQLKNHYPKGLRRLG